MIQDLRYCYYLHHYNSCQLQKSQLRHEPEYMLFLSMYVINKTLLIGQDKILHKVCLHTERALSKRWFNLRKYFTKVISAKR